MLALAHDFTDAVFMNSNSVLNLGKRIIQSHKHAMLSRLMNKT
jgi:hypothetical protein